MTHRSDRWIYNYKPTVDDDQTKIKCVATVTGLKSETEIVQLSIDCKNDYYFLITLCVIELIVDNNFNFLNLDGMILTYD